MGPQLFINNRLVRPSTSGNGRSEAGVHTAADDVAEEAVVHDAFEPPASVPLTADERRGLALAEKLDQRLQGHWELDLSVDGPQIRINQRGSAMTPVTDPRFQLSYSDAARTWDSPGFARIDGTIYDLSTSKVVLETERSSRFVRQLGDFHTGRSAKDWLLVDRSSFLDRKYEVIDLSTGESAGMRRGTIDAVPRVTREAAPFGRDTYYAGHPVERFFSDLKRRWSPH